MVIAAGRQRPFVWGEQDCCLFGCDCLAAVTGIDPAADWRGQYHDLEGALRLLHRRGFRSLEALIEAMAERCGWPEIASELAGRGDAGIMVGNYGTTLAIVTGRQIVVPGVDHLQFLPRALLRRTWKIG